MYAMPLPTADMLQEERENVEEERRRLQSAYDEFLVSWNKLQKQEQALMKKIQSYQDKTGVHSVLHHINSLT